MSKSQTFFFVASLVFAAVLMATPVGSIAQTPDRSVTMPAEQQRVTTLVNNMSTRFDVTITRLQDIAERLNSRSQKLSDADVDTTVANGHIANAKIKLDKAATLSAQTTQITESVFASGSPRDEWTTLRTHLMSVKKLIRDAHSDLLRALTSLQAAAVVDRSVSTSTAEDGEGTATSTDDSSQ